MKTLDELFLEIESLSKEGASFIVKVDGGRWADLDPLPFTVLVVGGRLNAENSFRGDFRGLLEGMKEGIRYYESIPIAQP